MQNEARSSFGGQATTAWRLKTLFTKDVQPLNEWPRSQSVVSEKSRNGLAPVISKTRLASNTDNILYVDLKTFFPAVHKGAVTAKELLKGLPEAFTDTIGALFGELTGEYDSAHGLGDPFRIYMGVLMGDVLSPHRAKILLDAVALAVRATAVGVDLWGAGDGRRLLQILYADDWAGLFASLD